MYLLDSHTAHDSPTVNRKTCGKASFRVEEQNTFRRRQSDRKMRQGVLPEMTTPMWRPFSRTEKMPIVGLANGALIEGCEIGRHSSRS